MKNITILVLTLIYTSLYAQSSMHDICPLKIGAEIPDVNLINENSELVSVKELTADTATVIVIYRGAWCGYCTQHLAELNDVKSEVESMGYQMLGVTIDQSSKIDESMSKIKNEIQVYSDSKAEFIKAFGLDWRLSDETYSKYTTEYNLDIEEWSGEDHHALPVPAVYVIKDGIVQFQYVNPTYSTRLKPETLLAVLKTL